MVDVVEMPAALFISDRTDPHLSTLNRSGGVALNGGEQIVSSGAQRWRFRAQFPILNKASARAIRVVKSKLKGRLNLLRLRICDQYRITRLDTGSWSPVAPVPFSDSAPFSDGSGFALAAPTSPITADADANATEIRIRASDLGGYMVAGVFISIKDYLYQIDDWELDGTDYVLQISPPLNGAVSTDDEVNFDAVALWQLESDDEGQLDLAAGRFGVVTLNLVEPITR